MTTKEPEQPPAAPPAVVVTAGHVDHGKSALVEALTGTHPDRLPQERARGMTIDLGFAWTTLPGGREVAFVDVPGHQRFLHNMLAGVGAVRAVLFVVDVTEGWMPQSEEHLAILDLLQVRCGVVALTKVDLAEPGWVELVREDVMARLRGSSLEGLPVLAVSALRREGLEELRQELDRQLARLAPAPDLGRPRLWIDRAFTLKGTGMVVTGTLAGGSLQVGQEVELLPDGGSARIRSLQTHRRPLPRALPGTRVAANLVGAGRLAPARGQAVVATGQWRLAFSPVVLLQLCRSAPAGQGLPARLMAYTGTDEQPVRVRLLEPLACEPGARCLAQLLLSRPLPLAAGDRFILREPGRQATVGGATVVDPLCEPLRGRQHRRLLPPSRRATARVLLGDPSPPLPLEGVRNRLGCPLPQAVQALVDQHGALEAGELAHHLPASPDQLQHAARELAGSGRLVAVDQWLLSPAAWANVCRRLTEELSRYHQEHPLSPGMPRETARSAVGLEARLFDGVLVRLARQGEVELGETWLRLAGFRPTFSALQQEQARRLELRLERAGFSPPTVEQLAREGFGEALVAALVEQGRLVRVNRELVFTQRQMALVQQHARRLFEEHGSVDPAALRDALGSSRRFVIPLLEFLDRSGLTRRQGDRRVWVGAAPGGPAPGPQAPQP